MSQQSTSDLTTEVVIIGGGLAGLSLSCALAGAGLPTICVDSSQMDFSPQSCNPPGHSPQVIFDPRTTAIAYGSKRLLDGIGVWPLLQASAEAILSIRVADAAASQFVHYNHRAIGSEPMGWVVENSNLRAALFQRLGRCPSLTHLTSAQAVELEYLPSGVRIQLADGRTLRARLVVGAEGRDSLTRRWARIQVSRWSYRQSAIVCNIAHQHPHRGIAIERFLPVGPFAVLPMTEQRSSIIWSEQASRALAYLSLPDQRFCFELQRRAGGHLGSIQVIGKRACYPLSFQLARRQIDERLALIGEAAHSIHPIAGQGFNMGLRDVAALAESIADTYRLGGDIGSRATLERFQRWRRFDNALLAGVCDGLVHLFSNDILPLRWIRRAGLTLTEHTPPVKRFLMHYAMGSAGQLPRLLRGQAL